MTQSEPTKILFVDTDPATLRGFRTRFRRNKQWSMYFATCIDEALLILKDHTIDVLVSDLCPPVQRGLAFLRQASQQCKIRVLLTGNTQAAELLHALPLTHQILHKPCSGDLIQDTIFALEKSIRRQRNPLIQKTISKITTLPVLASLHQELYDALNDESNSLPDICELLKQSPSLCARLLQWVNSCVLSPPHPISDLQEAVRILGLDMIRQMLIVTELFEHWEGHTFGPAFNMYNFQQYAHTVAHIAAQCAPEAQQRQAYTSGLLHNIGHLILEVYPPDPGDLKPKTTQHTNETDPCGFHQAELGAALLEIWGLPWALVEAVEHQHNLPWIQEHQHHLAGALYMAHHNPLYATPDHLESLLANQPIIP